MSRQKSFRVDLCVFTMADVRASDTERLDRQKTVVVGGGTEARAGCCHGPPFLRILP